MSVQEQQDVESKVAIFWRLLDRARTVFENEPLWSATISQREPLGSTEKLMKNENVPK